ncbi:uncharacterized protein [Nothobranchius furzeri]|nr:uncharacterized protein LOC129160205 [Nothobranchius furzeri]
MGRTLIPPGPCPILNCVPQLLHVEKHLDNHKELTQRRQREVKLALKRKVALQLLRELRATDTQPPMVSTLDLDGDPAAGEGNTCANPACRTRAMHLTNEVYRLQGALADAKRQLQQLQPQQASSPPEQRRGHGQGLRLSPHPSTSAPSRTSPTAPSSSSSLSSDDEGEERREQGQGRCLRSRPSTSAPSRASPTASSSSSSSSSDEEGKERREQGQGRCLRSRP